MNNIYSTIIYYIIFCTLVSSSSRIEVSPDGGYTGIVVKIKNNVPSQECKTLVKSLENLFQDASKVLHNALESKVYFKEITVVVPNDWSDANCGISLQSPRGSTTYQTPDVYIDDTDHIYYGKTPYTSQSRGCRQSGDFIRWPFSLSLTGNGSKGFVAEWAKYRYGIFDEFGFPNDPIYPHYIDNSNISNETLPTGSSDVRVRGFWSNSQGEECDPILLPSECYFVAHRRNDVTCSLAFLPFLDSVTRFCSKTPYFFSPTKHNGLCAGVSAQEVINDHFDLRSPPSLLRKTTLSFVRSPSVKYVILCEVSGSLAINGLWKWISKALQKFIRYDLPHMSQISIITFNANESSILVKSTVLSNDGIRSSVADSIPSKHKIQTSFSSFLPSCLMCGWNTTIKEILSEPSSESGTHLLLLRHFNSKEEVFSYSDEKSILDFLNSHQVKFSSLLLTPFSPHSFYDSISRLSGGKTFVFKISSLFHGTSLYFDLLESFEDLLALDNNSDNSDNENGRFRRPVTVHSAKFKEVEKESFGQFMIDGTLGKDTTFGILVEDAETHYINSVTFEDGTGSTYGPFTSFSSQFNVINLKTINFVGDSASPPFNDPVHLGRTNWKYKIIWYSGSDKKSSVVKVTSVPRRPDGVIMVESWTNYESASDRVTTLTPLVVYVRVQKGNSPVLSAFVNIQFSVISASSSNLTVIHSENIRLFDNGNGDPDLLSGDGIYSRYITQYYGPGRYQILVSVNDNNGTAYSVGHSRSGRAIPSFPFSSSTPICCGSQVVVSKEYRRPFSFVRNVIGPVIHLLEVPSKNVDAMPPRRIGDLRIGPNRTDKTIELQWTAPGNNFDTGNVSKYSVFHSENWEMTSRNKLIDFEIEADSGSSLSQIVPLTIFDKTIFLSLIAIDELGNESKLSNILSVYLPLPEGEIDPPSPVSPFPESEPDWTMIGIIVGVLLFFLFLLLLLLYIVFCKRNLFFKNSKADIKSSGVNVDLHHCGISPPVSESSNDSEIKNSSSHHLVLPSISGGHFGKTNSLSGTPTYWSASQLLKEHEERLAGNCKTSPFGCYINEGENTLDGLVAPRKGDEILPNYSPEDDEVKVSNGSHSSSSLRGSLLRLDPQLYSSKTRNITQV